MKSYIIGIIFIIGLALGIVGVMYGPEYLETYIPSLGDMGGGSGKPVEGKVVAKLPRADKLLITVSTSEGASLVTFDHKISEITLLVEEGDFITLKLTRYDPFINNPKIMRVRKSDDAFSEKKPAFKMPETPKPLPESLVPPKEAEVKVPAERKPAPVPETKSGEARKEEGAMRESSPAPDKQEDPEPVEEKSQQPI
jgi:hypothetical protein